MQYFVKANDLWEYALQSCLEYGAPQSTRQEDREFTYELLDQSLCLMNPALCFVTNQRREFNLDYWLREVYWTLSGRSRGDIFLEKYPRYQQYLEPDGTAYWAYGPRITPKLHQVIELLRRHPDSRRAVVQFWNAQDLQHAIDEDVKDIPCFTEMQFLIRDGELRLRVQMRSQDVWVGMPADLALMCTLQHLVASSLGLPVGPYTHRCMSLHVYSKHLKAADEAIESMHQAGLTAIVQHSLQTYEPASATEIWDKSSEMGFEDWKKEFLGKLLK